MTKHIEFDAPNISDLEKKYLCDCIDSGFVSTFGPFVSKFEKNFAQYLGVKKAVSTQSGTAAIHIALYELGVGKGDEVIVPALTFIATANPIVYLGARPIFVDVDMETWNINPEEIRKAITKKTKAIIPVHLYGNPCNMDEIIKISQKHNLYIIEDATQSLGAKYNGKYTGTFGDLGCFSFNGNKIITTGGGGMVVGNDKKRLEHIKFLVNQARDELEGYRHSEIGFNYRMTNLEAVLGLAQMTRLERFLKIKRNFNKLYNEELKSIKYIKFQKKYNNSESSYWLTVILFEKKIDLINLQKKLKEKGVPTGRAFMPIVAFPPYKKYKKYNYANSYNIFKKTLCLPSSTLNNEDSIYHVCKILKSLL